MAESVRLPDWLTKTYQHPKLQEQQRQAQANYLRRAESRPPQAPLSAAETNLGLSEWIYGEDR